MSNVGLFSRAKRFQQPAAANGGLDNDVEHAFEDSNSRFGKLVLSSSCGQEDSNCNGVVKSLMKRIMKTKFASKIVVKI